METDLLYDLEGDIYPVYEKSPIIEAKIGPLSTILLVILGMILTFASVKNIGNYGLFVVLGLVFVIGFLRPCDIVLVWLTFFYNPELAVGSGVQVFKLTMAISLFICIIHGKLSIYRLINKAIIGFFCFLLWLLFTILITPDRPSALAYYFDILRGIIVALLFMWLVTTEEEMGRVLKWWAIVAAISFIPVFVHYILGPNTWLYYVYEITAAPEKVGKGLVEAGGRRVGRLVWAGSDANGRGAMLLFPFGIALAYLMVSKARNKLFWAIVLGLISVCILGSFSRSTFISLVIILTLFAIVTNVRAIIPLAFVYLTGIMSILFIPAIRDRIYSIRENIIATGGSGRLYFWREAISDWMDSVIIGKGLRAFVALTEYEVHNTYLELLVDTGLVGFVIFCFLMGLACLWAFKSTKDREDIKPVFGKTIGCGMVGFCAMIGTVTYLSEMELWLAFAACFMLYRLKPEHLYETNLEEQYT